MGEFNQALWAPWRMEYLRSLGGKDEGGCFLCRYVEHPEQDPANWVLWRTPHTLTLFNRFPYSNGHLLVAPLLHAPSLEQLPDESLCDLMRQVRDAQRLLSAATSAQGYNVGINFGRCAGAGLPDHVHAHIVPRWEGDTNFMQVCGDTRVIPQSMDALYALLRDAAPRLGLPPLRG
jgi:ATP adenylyltransferase